MSTIKWQPTNAEHTAWTSPAPLSPLHFCRDHYPPKALPIEGENLDLTTGPVPFTARTEYTDQYFGKPWAPRPVEAIQSGIKAGPMLVVSQQVHAQGVGSCGGWVGPR